MNINEEYAGVVPSILVTPVNLKLKMKSKKEKNNPLEDLFFSFLRNLFHIQCIKLPVVIWNSAGWDVSKDSYNCKISVKYEVRLFPPFRCHTVFIH